LENKTIHKRDKEAWLREGLLALAQVGPQSLTVDIMCQRMGVTKGSFYHHFKNRQDYVEEILKFWEEENTSRLVNIADTQQGTEEKLDVLLKLVYEIPKDLEIAIRALALYDSVARQYQERIDTRRQAYLLSLNKAFFADSQEAELLATIDYAWYLGLLSILPEISKPKLQKLIDSYKMIKRLYMKAKSGDIE
jgi:AcrR family transcriptional regulator